MGRPWAGGNTPCSLLPPGLGGILTMKSPSWPLSPSAVCKCQLCFPSQTHQFLLARQHWLLESTWEPKQTAQHGNHSYLQSKS